MKYFLQRINDFLIEISTKENDNEHSNSEQTS